MENSEEELRAVLQKKWEALAENYCDESGINVLVSHLFMVRKGDELPEEPEDEKPILHVGGAQAVYSENISSKIQYTALGHLHRMHRVDNDSNPIYYSGSPLSYSFAEANQRKYVLMIDVEPGQNAAVKEVELNSGKRLLRKRAEGMEEALQWLSENQEALVELTLVTENYLTANDRKQLNKAHAGIVSIIPEVTNPDNLVGNQQKQIDLSRSMEELFHDYFMHEKGQEPNDEIKRLFTEILAEEE